MTAMPMRRLATRSHRLADAIEAFGYRTLVLTELATGEWVERPGSDPEAVTLVEWWAGLNHVGLDAAIERLLRGEELRSRAYSWRLA